MSQSKLMIGVVGLAIFTLAPIQLSSSKILSKPMETSVGVHTAEKEEVDTDTDLKKIKSRNIEQPVAKQVEFISIQQEEVVEVIEPVETPVVTESWIDINLHISFYTDLQSENIVGQETTDAQGNSLVFGTIAIPRDMPLGTRFTIDGFDGEFVGRDRGSKKYIKWVDNNTIKIDMFIPRQSGESNSAYHRRVNNKGIVKTTGKYLLPKE